MTWDRQHFERQVLDTGVLAPDYAADVLVRLAHHSTAIEGNTLSLSDTVTLLVDELAPAAGIRLREMYEVANHRQCLARILEAVADGEELTVELVTELHAALMDHLAHDRGEFTASDNRIAGASFHPPPASRVPELMREWVDQVAWQTAHLDGQALIEAIAGAHIAFERIHPFSDGNGRTGRAVIAYQTIRRFGFPAIVQAAQKSAYITALDAQDVPGLTRLLAENLAAEADQHRSPDPTV